jgi:mevalonate kinase
MGVIAELGLEALLNHDIVQLGDLMNINHGYLSSIGVSTMKLETLIHTVRKNGALGAKLTGAGGGGCIITIAEEQHIPRLEKAIRRRKSDSLKVNLTDIGVESRWLEEHADS